MSYLTFVLIIASISSTAWGDVSEIIQRPRFSLKSSPNAFNIQLTSESNEDDETKTFPRGFQLPQEHVRQPFRPDPHSYPIYHRPTKPINQAQVVDLEEKIPTHEGYDYPRPSKPFPEPEAPTETDFRPFEPTTPPTTEFVPSIDPEDNLLQVQELNNPTPWKPEGFFVFELPSPVASHHQSVVYYTLPRLTTPVGANFKQPIKGQHFLPKVFYLPPDYYHQRGQISQRHRF